MPPSPRSGQERETDALRGATLAFVKRPASSTTGANESIAHSGALLAATAASRSRSRSLSPPYGQRAHDTNGDDATGAAKSGKALAFRGRDPRPTPRTHHPAPLTAVLAPTEALPWAARPMTAGSHLASHIAASVAVSRTASPTARNVPKDSSSDRSGGSRSRSSQRSDSLPVHRRDRRGLPLLPSSLLVDHTRGKPGDVDSFRLASVPDARASHRRNWERFPATRTDFYRDEHRANSGLQLGTTDSHSLTLDQRLDSFLQEPSSQTRSDDSLSLGLSSSHVSRSSVSMKPPVAPCTTERRSMLPTPSDLECFEWPLSKKVSLTKEAAINTLAIPGTSTRNKSIARSKTLSPVRSSRRLPYSSNMSRGQSHLQQDANHGIRILQTLRTQYSNSDDEEARRRKLQYDKRPMGHRKHLHHEGARKRWKDEITSRERKRYEALWASNRGHLADLTRGGMDGDGVANLVVRDIWSRSRLPSDELAEVWTLVEVDGRGWLGRAAFVTGTWLIDQRLRGRKIPTRVSDTVWRSAKG